MEIAIIADDNKKELMAQFCIAYCGILSRHHLCATHITGKYISDATGLEIETFLAGRGGTEQIASKISFNEIDVVFYFRSTDPFKVITEAEESLLRLCDIHNIPLATNIATAEALVTALDSGALDWREFVNPRSEYNAKKRNKIK
jgi:methylglyoxal synthase